jgi:uncharacterized membrane protein YjdF
MVDYYYYFLKEYISSFLNAHDKLKHYIVCNVATILVALILIILNVPYLISVITSAFLVFFLSFAVEIFDKSTNKGNAEIKDILANTLGIISAIALTVIVLI